jgi:hypothetical protein
LKLPERWDGGKLRVGRIAKLMMRDEPMTKKYLVEFVDKSANATGTKNDGIAMSYSGDELLRRFEVDGIPFISGNRAGLVKLGELLIQIGLSEYKDGFHLHIREDFDEEKSELLVVGFQISN